MKSFLGAVRNKGIGACGRALVVLATLLLVALLVFSCTQQPTDSLKYAEVSDGFKTDYLVGDSFVASGEIRIPLGGDSYEDVPITAEMISGFDTSSAGDILVTVRYGDYKATVSVHVSERRATSLEIDEGTLPTVLYYKNPFPTTVTITVTMSDGSVREHVPVTSQMVGGFNPSVLGDQTISISYLGASQYASVLVKEDVRASIAPDGVKTEYGVGDPLDLTDARILVTYESGKTNYATMLPNNVSDFSTAIGGDHVAKVSYGGLECEYRYFVRKSAKEFALTANTLPAIYEKGDLLPDTGKGILTYDDGSWETVSLNSENFPDFSTATAGEKRVEVVVSGVTGIYSYTVLPGVYRVAISGFTENVRQNSEFDGLGEMVVVYEDEGFLPETLPFFGEDATRTVVSGENGDVQVVSTGRLRIEYRTSVAGDIVQKAYFRNSVGEFTVHVYDEAERATAVNGITIAGTFSPIRLGDAIDVTGVQVGIDYKYLDYAVVDCVPAWVSAVLPESLEGDYADIPVLVSYLGAEAQSSVRVLSAEYAAKVTALNVIGVPVLYSIGDEISLDSASAYVEYGGGYASNTVAARDLEVSGFDTSAAGEKTLTFTYGDGVYELTYRVLDEADKVLVTDASVAGFTPLLFVGDTVESIPRTYELTLILGYGYRSETLSLADESVTLSGGPFAEGGMQEVLLTCRGFEKTLRVMVYPASDKTLVTAIAVNDDVTASVGTLPDLSQVRLVVEYGHGYSRELLPLETTGVTVDREPFNGAQVGLVRTTVTYEGCTCGLFVNFVSGDGGNVLQRLETSADSKASFTIGEELNGVELILHYKSGTERLAVTAEMVPDFDTETAGEHTVTVSYGGKGVLFTYTVA